MNKETGTWGDVENDFNRLIYIGRSKVVMLDIYFFSAPITEAGIALGLPAEYRD